MSVLLAHLVARTPTVEDFSSIVELVAACDSADYGIAESGPESYHKLCTMGSSVSTLPPSKQTYSTRRRSYDNDPSHVHDSRCA